MESLLNILLMLAALAVFLLIRLRPQILRELERQQAQGRRGPPRSPTSPDRPGARRDAPGWRREPGPRGTDESFAPSPRAPSHRPASEEALEEEPWWPRELAPEGEEALEREAARLQEAEAEAVRIREQARSRRAARSPEEALELAGSRETGGTPAPRARPREARAPGEEPLRPAPESHARRPGLPRGGNVRDAFRFMELIRPPVTLRRRDEVP